MAFTRITHLRAAAASLCRTARCRQLLCARVCFCLQRHFSVTAIRRSNPDDVTIVTKWRGSVLGRQAVLWDHIDSRQITLLDQTIRPYLPCNYPSMPRNPKVGDIAQGTAVPPSAHLVYFPSHANELELSPDGYHADEAPPEPFSQRVWAGARIEFNISNPLRVGEIASQTKSIESVQVKERQGADPLVVVGLTLAIQNTNGFSVTEFRDLIYMKPVHLQRRVLKYNRTPDFGHEIIPTEVLMFRYSALSWNSHRIHYDSVYARNVEHHPGLLVHGPLTCTLLLQLLQANMPNGMTLKTFDYRALSPLYCQQKMTLNGRWMKAMLDSADESKNSGAKACELWATNDEGGLAMKGVATIVPVAPNGQ